MFSKLRKQRRLRAFGGTQVSAPHVSHSYDCKSEISVCQLPSTYSHPESYGLTFSSTRHPLLCIRTEYRTDRRPGHREARWKKAQVGAWRPNLFLSLVNTCWNEELLFKWKTPKEPISTSSWISCTGAVALGVQDLTPCMESLNTYERWCGSCCQQWAYGLPGSGWIPSLLRERDPGKHPELARPVISMHFFSLSEIWSWTKEREAGNFNFVHKYIYFHGVVLLCSGFKSERGRRAKRLPNIFSSVEEGEGCTKQQRGKDKTILGWEV